METPVSAPKAEQPAGEATKSEHGQSLSTALNVGGLFLVSDSGSVVAMDTGATSNLARLCWLGRIIVFWSGRDTRRLRLTRRPPDFDREVAAWAKCVAQRIYL